MAPFTTAGPHRPIDDSMDVDEDDTISFVADPVEWSYRLQPSDITLMMNTLDGETIAQFSVSEVFLERTGAFAASAQGNNKCLEVKIRGLESLPNVRAALTLIHSDGQLDGELRNPTMQVAIFKIGLIWRSSFLCDLSVGNLLPANDFDLVDVLDTLVEHQTCFTEITFYNRFDSLRERLLDQVATHVDPRKLFAFPAARFFWAGPKTVELILKIDEFSSDNMSELSLFTALWGWGRVRAHQQKTSLLYEIRQFATNHIRFLSFQPQELKFAEQYLKQILMPLELTRVICAADLTCESRLPKKFNNQLRTFGTKSKARCQCVACNFHNHKVPLAPLHVETNIEYAMFFLPIPGDPPVLQIFQQ